MKKNTCPVIEKRLELILQMIPTCEIVADIGCDHAYVSICLIKRGLCKKVYACDIKKGPLETAKKNIEKYGCGENIETILAPGLDGVIKRHIDACIIAGMGAEMICDIIESHKEEISSDTMFIFQPMSKIEVLRKYLYYSNFEITDEKLCLEDRRVYNVICAKKADKKQTVKDEIYYIIGEKLVENKDELLEFLLQKKIKEYEKIKKGLALGAENFEKSAYIENMLSGLKRIREEIS